MTRILSLFTAQTGANSKSNPLVKRFTAGLAGRFPEIEITERDLGAEALPHIDDVMIGAFYTADEERTAAQRTALSLSDELLDELIAAEVIVIGAPMYNFSVPSSLKNWLDHVSRVGRSFRYTDTGPEGLITGKKVYVIATSGGNYGDGSPVQAMDHRTTYLKTVLGFLGMDDVSFIHAFGVAGGDQGIRAAESEIDDIITSAAVLNAA